VVETSPHSLIAGDGGSGEAICSRSPVCIDFLKDAMPKSSTQQRSLRTLAQHLMAQLPSLQGPCAVKMALKEDFSTSLTEKTSSLGSLGTPLLRRIFLSI
jgi:hypothetical protein